MEKRSLSDALESEALLELGSPSPGSALSQWDLPELEDDYPTVLELAAVLSEVKLPESTPRPTRDPDPAPSD